MGMWATPATWYASYPEVPLNFIQGERLSELSQIGFSVVERFFDIAELSKVYGELDLL